MVAVLFVRLGIHSTMVTIGIDISKEYFTASACRQLPEFMFKGKNFDNTTAGFHELFKTIKTIRTTRTEEVTICMEYTGVYLEHLCHFFHATPNIRICIEPPQHIKRSFQKKDRNDKIDSAYITEHAIRFADTLTTWVPPDPAVDTIAALLAERERLKKDQKAQKSSIKTYQKKVFEVNLTRRQNLIDFLETQKDELEEELKTALKQNPEIYIHAKNLMSIKCIKLICVCNFCVLTGGFKRHDYKHLASLLGFTPREHTSGSSVRWKEKTDRCGPSLMRKNLHLAARNSCKFVPEMKEYYLRMQAKGKDKYLIYNNVAYKLLKIMCAIIRDGRPYDPDYKPIPPDYFK